MAEQTTAPVNTDEIKSILDKHKDQVKLSLKLCAHCTLCAESCFLFHVKDKDPRYMPSHKFINSIGKLYKKKGNVSRKTLEEISEIVWRKCVLCTRCYCPFGIDIPKMIALARQICRSQGVVQQFDKE
ncbi:MAG: 4Fe-4S dicluster domain-containing protein [Desulfobacterales bacterium]|nr:4Fe-4S dicluster domain-containing protein [Desulfobacterales bacterium]